jgi:hypothetical protein
MYRAAVDVEERLARDDPKNAVLQRDLAFSHADLGEVLVNDGKLPEATDHLNKARSIIAGLLQRNPDNKQWQQDLVLFDSRIAAVPR